MKTIKKTTLIAAITAMAAFAVPSMASAAVWGPINTNQSLDTSSANYNAIPGTLPYGFVCAQHLGVHVRTPASSSIDVTSASFSSCIGTGGATACPATATPTGLPWTATALSSTSVNLPVHLQATFTGACTGITVNVDGLINGTWSASTHTLVFSNASGLTETFMGSTLGTLTFSGSLRNPTQTLTLT